MKHLSLLLLLTLVACAPDDPKLTGNAPQPQPKQSTASYDLANPKPAPAAQPVAATVPAPKPPPPPPPPPPKPPEPKPVVLKFQTNNIPLAAVAWEDRFPERGDEDFNDFMTDFQIFEIPDGQNNVKQIVMDFYPRTVGGSFDHSLLLILNGKKDLPSNITLATDPVFQGDATATLALYDASGNFLSQKDVRTDRDVVIFESTHAVFDPAHLHETINTLVGPKAPAYIKAQQTARLTITLKDPTKNPMPKEIEQKKFRMILHVKPSSYVAGTGKKRHTVNRPAQDIDIIDVDPQNFEHDTDHDNYPYGFIIKSAWRWPQEGVSIDLAYPSFANYRSYLLSRKLDPKTPVSDAVLHWYDTPGVEKYLYPEQPVPKLLPDPK